MYLDGYFYVIGGCKGTNYTLLGDAYRVDLTNLVSGGCFEDFEWELRVENDRQLERWGHSSDVYEGKVYISCGRISSSQDSS